MTIMKQHSTGACTRQRKGKRSLGRPQSQTLLQRNRSTFQLRQIQARLHATQEERA